MRCLVWAAVSSHSQAEKVSLEDQLAEGEAEAEREGLRVVGRLVVPGKSRRIIDPAEAVEEIKAYRDLAALADAGAFDVLVYRSADRLGRTRTLVAWVQEMLAERGIRHWDLEAGALPGEADPLLDAVRGGMSAREAREFRRRWRSGMRGRFRRVASSDGRLS